MADLSAAADLAWQAAADEALQAHAVWINPEHLLAGACSVEKLIAVEASKSDGKLSQTLQKAQEECMLLNEAFSSCRCETVALRRELRKRFQPAGVTTSPTSTVRRSPASREAFARAERISAEGSVPTIGLLALVLALLDPSSSHIASSFSELNVDTVEIVARLRSLLAFPDTTPTNAIAASFNASSAAYSLNSRNDDSARLALLYELPLQFGKSMPIDELLRLAVSRISLAIPGATHAAFLMRDRKTGALLLQAHIPSGTPAVSITLAQRAMERCEGLLWLRGESDSTASLDSYGLHSCIYAPLVRDNQPLGVLCIGSKDQRRPLSAEDLRLVVALAQHAAMALSNRLLQNDLHLKSNLLERLLTNFSPRVRDALLEKAARGRLRLGGEKSEVTILFSDIRGFTRMSANLSADEVADLLNDYFSALVDTILRHDGTIDKFVGDAILSVFGSPEPDPAHHEKAVRTALAMQAAMRERNDSRGSRGLPTCEIGIGVHCGEVFHGFIGSAERMEFTVIGDAVNRAARYCAGAAGGEVLLSPSVHQCVWRLVDVQATAVATKHEGEFPAFRLLRLK